MAGSELVRACEQYLQIKGIFHYRNNSGALKTATGGFVRFGAVGSPDLIAVIKGQYIGIECKMGTGRQSPGQKEFEKNLIRAGGKYWLIRDVQELIIKLL